MTERDGFDGAKRAHLDRWRAANAQDAPHAPASVRATPLQALAEAAPADDPLRGAAAMATLRRHAVSFETRLPAHEVWAALADFPALQSDIRRLSPAFRTVAMYGALSPAPGDVYRLEDRRAPRIAALARALSAWAPDMTAPDVRRADIVIHRCGPLAGETGEVVADAGVSHPRAGRAALWVLMHPDGAAGRLRVALDAAEIACWAWAPDWLAARDRDGEELDSGIVDWPWLFERLLATTGGEPIAGGQEADRFDADWRTLAREPALAEALHLHPTLADIVAALDAGCGRRPSAK
jgi:hypothetical protein